MANFFSARVIMGISEAACRRMYHDIG
jgi:hypothetical protein